MSQNRKDIIGFRRVHGRVVPISGHIAGNAGLAAIGLGGASSYILKNANKELAKAKFANKASVSLRKRTFETYGIIKSARKNDLITSGEFLHQRNTVYSLLDQGKKSFESRKAWTGRIASEIRTAAKIKKVAFALGALSLGALAYQGLTNGKKRR